MMVVRGWRDIRTLLDILNKPSKYKGLTFYSLSSHFLNYFTFPLMNQMRFSMLWLFWGTRIIYGTRIRINIPLSIKEDGIRGRDKKLKN